MTGKTVTADPSAIAIGWSMQFQLDQQRILTAQTHVPLDADPKAIKDTLGKIADAMDWMAGRYELPVLEEQITRETRLRDEVLAQTALMEKRAAEAYATSGRKGAPRLSPSEETQKRNFETTVTRHNLVLGDLAKKHTVLKKMLNGAGASGA